MAVAFDAAGPSATGQAQANTTTINWNHTCSGVNRLLVVGVSIGRGVSTDTTTVTSNGVSMTSAGSVFADNQNDGYVQLFYLASPALGTHNIVVTCNNARDLVGGSSSFTGVDQTTPISNTATAFGSDANPTVNVTSATNNMVVDIVGCGTSVTSSNQTQRWLNNLNNTSGAGNAAQSTAAGAATTTMSYSISNDWWGIVAMNINAATSTPPTIVSSSGTGLSGTTGTKSVNITTQAGDLLVVYGGSENSPITLGTPSGNSVSFTLRQSVVTSNFATAYIWTGTDATGGTNWTLSSTLTGISGNWGFTCVILRNTGGVGTSNNTTNASGAPSLSLTTSAHSAVIVFTDDWSALDGAGRTWQTVNSNTPTTTNGLELDYTAVGGAYTAYGAYYPDTGSAGTTTVGLTAPTGQKYSIVAQEVLAPAGTATPTAVVAWLTA